MSCENLTDRVARIEDRLIGIADTVARIDERQRLLYKYAGKYGGIVLVVAGVTVAVLKMFGVEVEG